jgi:hypothetical protein
MTMRYWLLGSHADLAIAGSIVSELLGVDLNEHDSDYRGGSYLRGSAKWGREVIVQTNFEDDQGYLAEPEFPDCPTLIYVEEEGDALSAIFCADPRLSVLRVEEL